MSLRSKLLQREFGAFQSVALRPKCRVTQTWSTVFHRWPIAKPWAAIAKAGASRITRVGTRATGITTLARTAAARGHGRLGLSHARSVVAAHSNHRFNGLGWRRNWLGHRVLFL